MRRQFGQNRRDGNNFDNDGCFFNQWVKYGCVTELMNKAHTLNGCATFSENVTSNAFVSFIDSYISVKIFCADQDPRAR